MLGVESKDVWYGKCAEGGEVCVRGMEHCHKAGDSGTFGGEGGGVGGSLFVIDGDVAKKEN